MQVSLEGYYNAVKPQVAGEELLGNWTIRTQSQVLFSNRTLLLAVLWTECGAKHADPESPHLVVTSW